MSREERDNVYTRWSDAYPPAHELAIKLDELKEAPSYTYATSLLTKKNASLLFSSICKIGGKEGWFNNKGFWRVEDLKHDEMLLLRAEMKLPGRAWLEFRIDKVECKNRLSVKGYYQTRGIFGKIYWYIFLPFHNIIFNDLIKQIEKRS